MRLLGFTADNLLRMAVVVSELESRGEDLSGLRLSLLPALRAIAAGQLLPAAVVKYAGQTAVLRKLTCLPLAEQQMVLDGTRPAPPAPAPHRYGSSAAQGGGPRLKVPVACPDVVGTPPAEPGDDDLDRRAVDVPPDDGPKLGVAGMAARGNPRDVGEMAADLILNCLERGAALARLVDRLVAAGVLGRPLGDAVKETTARAPARRPFWAEGD